MQIRPYQDSDHDVVIQLWRDCGLTTLQNNSDKDIQRKLAVDPDLFLVACVNSEVIATVMGGYEGHRGWVNYLGVTPSMQGKGYGRELMLRIESLLKAKGCPKLNLQVRANNKNAIAFYTALGFLDDKVIGLGKRLEND